jgi:transposase-like protein
MEVGMASRALVETAWRERLERFAVGRQTVGKWCAQEGVTPHQYRYWRRRLNGSPRSEADDGPWVALKVQAPDASCSGSGITLRIAGAAIDVAPGFDAALLRGVVQALADLP